MGNDVKPFWHSKTFWANLVMCAAAFIPAVHDKLTPEVMATAFAAVNVLLRFISKGKVTLS